jgi:hypothetical protein
MHVDERGGKRERDVDVSLESSVTQGRNRNKSGDVSAAHPGRLPRPDSPEAWFALALGLFLGLCIWKFGNPVILDKQVGTPGNFDELMSSAWPSAWAYWGLLPLMGAGGLLVVMSQGWNSLRGILVIPLLVWLGWQFVSATRSVDAELTRAVVWQFCGCVGMYFAGVCVVGRKKALSWLLVGILAAFAWCLVRAANQKWIEYPRERAELIEGERSGWTNFPPAFVGQLRADGFIIVTNGVEVANPLILEKYRKGRVSGTVVYPNALAGLILLLLPASLVLAVKQSGVLRGWLRGALILLVMFLGLGGLVWSGSKLGWLVAVFICGIWALRLDWSRKLKLAAVVAVLVLGCGLFAIRFQGYLAGGSTSLGARFDYWSAAAKILEQNPVFGSGPGTFQRGYSEIKAPGSEMARLVHNDYLEQFCDSGWLGGIAYLVWIALALWVSGRDCWRQKDPVRFAVWLGVLGWFVQGIGEFSLYIPALGWMAFALLGCLVAKPVDSRNTVQ